MKEKLLPTASRYLIQTLMFLPVLLVMRVVEYLYLKHTFAVQDHPWLTEGAGLIFDLKVFFILVLVMFIPFLLVALLSRKGATLFYAVLLGLLTLLQFALIRYFAVNLAPLGDVLYAYSFDEIMMIIRSSNGMSVWSFLPIVLILALVFLLQWAATRIRIKEGIWPVITAVYVMALFLALIPPCANPQTSSEMAAFHRINKSAYFLEETTAFLLTKEAAKPMDEVVREINRYQKIHQEFDFTSKSYPFVHKNRDPDVLGPYFNLKKEPPNLVFIIVESLSQACIGDHSYFGNFSPFLDSLKNQSLYFDNFLSISERTFHVFAALFGSLPYGGGEFQKDLSQIPFHYSLIRYLRENGYFTAFYYGGAASFTNYDQFLKKQGIDLIMGDFGPAYREKKKLYPDFFWGYHDEFTYARSIEVIDSLKKEPRLDIYLTLSTHHPYRTPDHEKYIKEYEEITAREGFPPAKKEITDRNKKIFAAMLYSDHALKEFIQAYSKRDDFQNTIFFITGDHFFMELGYSAISAIERYHVPMIIYSPLLKKPHHFESVSSHQDITPSVIAMLRDRYHFTDLPYVHWLGQGIDTSTAFRNIHTLQFVTCDLEYVDYLDKDYFLSKGKLYQIEPGLKTHLSDDSKSFQRMQEDLMVTTEVSTYAAANNRVILPELFHTLKYDTIPLLTFDTSGLFFGKEPYLFIRLVRPFRFDTSYWEIKYELSFKFMITEAEDTAKLPSLIFSLVDSSFNNLIYHQAPFPDRRSTEIKPGVWYPFQISEMMNLSSVDSLKGTFLKTYFFNNRYCHIQYDSLYEKLSGIN
ncbi:MAG: LTA synthase family protein [Bacteroidales bacterium]|nr:LTA synthase family protein [Bacteroidales bacterium]